MGPHVESGIRAYGYWGVFLWAILGGEESVLMATWFVQKGLLTLPGVLVASALGGAVGDQIFFHLARRYGYSRLCRSAGAYERARAWIARYGARIVLASRFLAGLRIAIPLACGALGMSPLTFSLLNLLSAFCWALFYTGILTWVWSVFRVEDIAGVGLGILGLLLLSLWVRSRRRDRGGVSHQEGGSLWE